MIHSSDTRTCYVNNIKNNLNPSGDKAIFKNNKLYLKGRIDRTVKINSKLVDLNNLEAVNFLNYLIYIVAKIYLIIIKDM